MALAPLGFTVDTGPVAKAVADLDRLTGATAKADAATKSVSAGTNAAAVSARQLGAATAAAATQMTIATNAVQANNAALQISNQSAGMAQQSMRNLAFQFQDIGTMLASGQSPFMLLAQQLPQITMHGGKLTGVMGALRQTISGLFSPLGLVTTGFVLATSAAISYFSSTDDETKKAAEALEEQRDLISRVADEWNSALPQVRAYADELGRARQLEEGREVTGLTIDKEFDQAAKSLDGLKGKFDGIVEGMIRIGASADVVGAFLVAVRDVEDAATAMREEIKRGGDETDEFGDLQSAVADILNNQAASAISGLAGQVQDLGDDYLTAGKKAVAAAQAFHQALSIQAAADANRGRFEKTGGRVTPGTAPPLDPTEFLSRFGWGEVFDFPTDKKGGGRGRRGAADRSGERYADMIRDSQQFIAAQKMEADALFMTEEAASALRHEHELLAKAANDNIKLTPAMEAELRHYAQAMAAAEAQTDRLRESQEAMRDAAADIGGIFRGMIEGTMSWKDALLEAIPVVLTLLNDLNKAGGGKGLFGGGVLQSLLGGFLGLPFAKGGAFSGGNVVPFAKGGVVSQPTLFPMAKGAGLMGEAGPEGILPLRRAADGRLGVASVGREGSPAPLAQVHVTVGVDQKDGLNLLPAVRHVAQGEAAASAAKVARAVPSLVDQRNDQRQMRRLRPGF